MNNNKKINNGTIKLTRPELQENERYCPACDGYGYVINGYGRVQPCPKCDWGKVYLCPHGNMTSNVNSCSCAECIKDRYEKSKESQLKIAKARPLKDVPEDEKMMFFSEYMGEYGDYFEDIEDLVDYCLSNGKNIPDYVWPTSKSTIGTELNANYIVEQACENLHENAMDFISNDDIKALDVKLQEWASGITGTDTYYQIDYYRIDIKDEVKDILEKRKE